MMIALLVPGVLPAQAADKGLETPIGVDVMQVLEPFLNSQDVLAGNSGWCGAWAAAGDAQCLVAAPANSIGKLGSFVCSIPPVEPFGDTGSFTSVPVSDKTSLTMKIITVTDDSIAFDYVFIDTIGATGTTRQRFNPNPGFGQQNCRVWIGDDVGIGAIPVVNTVPPSPDVTISLTPGGQCGIGLTCTVRIGVHQDGAGDMHGAFITDVALN